MNSMKKYPATLLCDFYKVAHHELYPDNTEVIYSTWIPRSNRYLPQADGVVTFGVQYFIKELENYFHEMFFTRPCNDVVEEYQLLIDAATGEMPNVDHIRDLWNLRYLPLEIRALPEGLIAPIKTPMLTIQNTDKKFFWVTNYIETLLSVTLWKPMTSATIALQYRKLAERYAMTTVGNIDGTRFQIHDFSMRGMSSLDSADVSGAAHLAVGHFGTDTIPSIPFLETYYNADCEKELIGTSIYATEHSIMSSYTPANGDRDEYHAFKELITKKKPYGFMSIVSDTYNLWKVLTDTLPRLKEEILSRTMDDCDTCPGRIVIRPDSGNPVDILCGTIKAPIFDNAKHASENLKETTVYYDNFTNSYMEYNVDTKISTHVDVTPEQKGVIQILWETFGGHVNEKGFKELDPHIGAIYGDSITLERAEEIFNRLMCKGFASTNVVLGIGSYTYNYNTRDTLGFAVKATYGEYNGEKRMLFKDPITDDGTKRSLTGKVFVWKDEDGTIKFRDGLLEDHEELDGHKNLLEVVYKDGMLVREETSLKKIRSLVSSQI